jgi:hypothetical protein
MGEWNVGKKSYFYELFYVCNIIKEAIFRRISDKKTLRDHLARK